MSRLANRKETLTVIRTWILLLTFLQLVASCSYRNNGPVIHSVCMQVSMEPPEALAFFNRTVASKFRDYGFALATENCEVTVKYTRLGEFQGERYIAQKGYWSEEGILSVSHEGRLVVEGQPVDLRGYKSRLDLIANLASEVVRSVLRRFQPRANTAK